jgi:hypothetical protein
MLVGGKGNVPTWVTVPSSQGMKKPMTSITPTRYMVVCSFSVRSTCVVAWAYGRLHLMDGGKYDHPAMRSHALTCVCSAVDSSPEPDASLALTHRAMVATARGVRRNHTNLTTLAGWTRKGRG